MDAFDRPLRRRRRALPERVRDVRARRDRRLTLLYDSDCGFCRTALALILRWDRRGAITPLALQAPEAPGLLPGMDEEARMASFHLVEGTTVSSGGSALTELLRALPGGGPLAALAGGVQPATDALYRLVAGNRSRLGPLIPAEVKARADATIERRRAAKAGL